MSSQRPVETPSVPGSFVITTQEDDEQDSCRNTNATKSTTCEIEETEPKENSSSTSSTPKPTISNEGLFECNICLDMASEPVVTLCGHLFW